MKTINGSFGEGGGQILRTSLSLSAITGMDMHIKHIRANRPKPGMMRQHLACAKAVAEICGGELEGAELSSQELVLRPGKIRGGSFHFAIGSAGSTILLAQAVLPVLLFADEPSEVILEGGTYNTTDSPCFDFFKRVYLPCLSAMGLDVEARMERIGFCPVGGGRIVLSVKPARGWKTFSLCERGDFRNAWVTALGSRLDESILHDELRIFQDEMADTLEFKASAQSVEADGSGNVLFAELEYGNLTELFAICGKFGVTRKTVAQRVAGMTRQYLENNWVAGLFLADQLLLPMTLGAGGVFLTGRPTLHSETNREVIRQFLDVDIKFNDYGHEIYEMEVIK